MALQTEIWVGDIQDALYQDAQFILKSVSHDGYVSNKTVHVPQSGAGPSISVDRSSLPATITQRTDTDLTYSLNEYTTDPILIRNLDELQISYDKRQSVVGQHTKILSETIGNKVAYVWGGTPSAGRIVRTTGTATASALANGATGTRNQITVADVANLQKILDKDLIPQNDRYLLLPSDMYWDLFAISDVVRASAVAYSQTNLASGVVAELLGFKIMRRAVVQQYNAAATTIKDTSTVAFTGAATDQLGAIAWHPSYVAKALGSIDLFSDSGDNGKGKPEYYGIILSALVMLGSTKLRTDNRGVAYLVQQ